VSPMVVLLVRVPIRIRAVLIRAVLIRVLPIPARLLIRVLRMVVLRLRRPATLGHVGTASLCGLQTDRR